MHNIEDLAAGNKDKYKYLYNLVVQRKLEKTIYSHILSMPEKTPVDLYSFKRDKTANISQQAITCILEECIIPKLNKNGYNCAFCFGSTCLFIYATDMPIECCPEKLFKKNEPE